MNRVGLVFRFFFYCYFTVEVLGEGGITRVVNRSLQLPDNPPGHSYETKDALPGLTFTKPLAITHPPGETNRLFIVEQGGAIWMISDLENPSKTKFLDITDNIIAERNEEGLLGMAFHPDFADNGYFFIFYTVSANTEQGNGRHDRLSRFKVKSTPPYVANRNSEVIFLQQLDDAANHNGGDLHFGPDGYLYISLGDEGRGDDLLGNSQTIEKDFFSGILRIDVDKRAGHLPSSNHDATTSHYGIPPDNPYVNATTFNGKPLNASKVLKEFWAVGLRNPWRFSFDSQNGALYCGDVGQDDWEEVNIIKAGGNYGWNFREGDHVGFRSVPAGVELDPPLLDYGHGTSQFKGNSVTGGIVYRGSLLPELYGAYIFADFSSGNIWSLRHEGESVTEFNFLTNDKRMAAFGVDPRNGELLMADHGVGKIMKLARSGDPIGEQLPEKLSDTGVFSSLETLTPNPGIYPYDVNLSFWSDGAKKTRWFSIPGIFTAITFSSEDHWEFPLRSVWVKHFDLEMIKGEPASARRLETRLLVRNEKGVYGMTYRWREDESDADLVGEDGVTEIYMINDGGTIRPQEWYFPGQSDCLACHTREAGWILGFDTAQLNREFTNDGNSYHQLWALEAAGFFDSPLPRDTDFPKYVDLDDSTVSVAQRVRSYLAANCSQCHRPGGQAIGNWDARLSTPTLDAGILEGLLAVETGEEGHRIVRPGESDKSAIFLRVSERGTNRQMPPIGSKELDTRAIELLREWIDGSLNGFIAPEQSFETWQHTVFASGSDPDSQRFADPDKDGLPNYWEYLLDRDPTNPKDRWNISIEKNDDSLTLRFPSVRNRGFQVILEETKDLVSPNWTRVDRLSWPEDFTSETDSTISFDESLDDSSCSFYRIRFFEP